MNKYSKGNKPFRFARRYLYLKCHSGTLWVVCFLCCVIVFLLKTTYVDWGLWDRNEYLSFPGCNESVFKPENGLSCSPRDITDSWRELQYCQQCEASNDPPLVQTFPPTIKTHCGFIKSIPISRVRKQTTVRTSSRDHQPIPNVIHYVSLGVWEFKFLNYLSFKSVDYFLRPDYIVIHGDGLPYGQWWNKTVNSIANIFYAPRPRAQRIDGVIPQWVEHATDILRLQILYENGGIYVDSDVLVLRDFEDLIEHPVVLGRETWYGLGSSIILSKPRSPFLCMWIRKFKNYSPYPWNWARYAVWHPNDLSQIYPQLIHVINEGFFNPNFDEPSLLFHGHYNWSQSYAMHIWHRGGVVPNDPGGILHLDTTLGEVMRHVYMSPSTRR